MRFSLAELITVIVVDITGFVCAEVEEEVEGFVGAKVDEDSVVLSQQL